MRGQHRRAPKRRVARAALALLATVMTVLALAAPASASPETDAADAINAAFAGSGGPTGPLGAESGDVYPIGTGFARNYANGRIYFTPATGARSVFGAILAKYDELGGPADGDLGFPTDSELPGAFSLDSRYSTFADGVIYYTGATGAWLVRGPINAAWDKLGSTSSPLGAPVDDARWNGHILTQRFTGGELSWDIATGTFTSVPPELAGQLADLPAQQVEPNVAINAAWRGLGGPTGVLGAKQGDLYPVGRDGIGQDFAGGAVFFSTETGPNVVTGAILEKYLSLGGPGGELGFPTASETDGGIPNSRISSFAAQDNPVIFWTPEHGAIVVRGAINAAWGTLGGAPAQIGVPVSEQTTDGDVTTQVFSGGEISYNSVTKQYTTVPPELAGQLGGIEVPTTTVAPPPTTEANALPAADGAGAGFNWTWWWFVVPLLVLLLAVAGALLWRRERKKGDSGDVHATHDDDADSGAFERVDPARLGAQDGADDDLRDYPPPPGRKPFGSDSADNPWGRNPDQRGSEQREPVVLQKSDSAPGRPGAAGSPDGWDEGQDDIDTDAFAPVDEPPAPVSGMPEPTPSSDDDDSANAAAATTSIPLGARPAQASPPRRTYGYESVPMFEPWRPDATESDDAPREADQAPREEAAQRFGERRHGDDRHAADDRRGDDRYIRREPYRPSPYFAETHDEPTGEPQYGAPRHAEGRRRQESVLKGAHLPMADRNRAPRGYPIKGDARTGNYYTPDNPGYASAEAEIWFDTEESARASGFFKDR